MKRAIVFWFTGLSGSGKTTISDRIVSELQSRGKIVKVYDGDAVRQELNSDLGFTPEDIKENNRRIAELCEKNRNSYDYIFVPIICPFEEIRLYIKKKLGKAVYIIFCRATIVEVKKRDPKGLYAKASRGEIENFIGVDKNVPFEDPANADLVMDTGKEPVEDCVKKFMNFIGSLQKGFVDGR